MNEETSRIIDEVLQIFASPSDFKRIEGISLLQGKLELSCQKQRQELKTIIGELTEKNRKATEHSKRMSPIEEHEKRVTMLKRELDGISFSISHLEKSSLEYQEKIQEFREKQAQLLQIEEQEKLRFIDMGAKHKKIMSLYTNVAPIDWRSQGDTVSGYILGTESIKSFQYVQKSEFEICNSLWEKLASI